MNKHPSAENTRDAAPVDEPKARKAKPKAAKRTCIMVLGMHRSGTSALTRAINLLGAELPKNMLGANLSNPTGHWEPERLIALHDQMLAEAGSSWDDWRSFDPNDLGAQRLRFYKAEIARLIDEEYGSAPFFVLKEPRISRFVPLYAEILRRMRIDVRYVLIDRNPLAVIASLANRNGFTMGFSSLLWLRHELEAERATRGRSRILLSYESLLDDWRQGIDGITATLSLDWPVPDVKWQSLLSEHFATDNQHFTASTEVLDADLRIIDWVKDAYTALIALRSDDTDAVAIEILDRIRAEFESVSRTFGDAFFPEIDCRLRVFHRQKSEQQQLAKQRDARPAKQEPFVSLRDLYDAHRGKVSDKWSIYLSTYDHIFSEYRDRPVRILEIGVQNGGSLEIWQKYFPNAELVLGCDINSDCGNLVFDDKRIEISIGDANTDEVERDIVSRSKKFDIIIDDGSHLSSDIIRSFARYFPHLSEGGMYIAEDLHCSYWQEFEGGLYDPLSSMSFFKRLLDVVNHEHWGLDRRRVDALATFADRHQVAFNEASLASVHSVEFLNSLCIVTKLPIPENVLGARSVHGQVALADQGMVALDETRSKATDQTGNPWSLKTTTMEAEIEINRALVVSQEARIEAYSGEIAALTVEREHLRAATQALESAHTSLAAKDEHIAALEHKLQERDRQMALLNHEIELVHSSRTWRYRSVWKRLVSPLTDAILYAGRTITLNALHHLEGVPLGKGATEWTITGDDPQFELLWPGSQPLLPGHYRLSVHVPAETDALTNAHLYIDSGKGYNEFERIDLRFRSNGKSPAVAVFSLDAGAQKLRVDPGEGCVKIAIGRVRLRRLGRIEYYASLIGRVVARQVKNPGALVRSAARGVTILRQGGLRGFAAMLRSKEVLGPPGSVTYERWIALNDTPTEHDVADLRQRLTQLENKPLISVLMPVYNTPEKLLREAIDSVRAQVYENWELCIADDCSTKPYMRRVLNEYAKRDPRIKIVLRDKNGHISHASNSALELVTGEWVALLDHDDLLRPHALAEIVLEVDRHPDAELIYSDEDKIDAEGRRYDPCFKPDFSRELFRSQNYLNHLTVHRAENIRAVGGWRPGFEGSQDYDLNLRVFERIAPERIRHIPKVLYHWRAVEGSTALDGSQKSYAYVAGLRALEEHVERMNIPAKAEEGPGTASYRLHFFVPEPQPFVSLIVPTRDKVELLRNCVESIREKTTYRNYEILVVDNGSVEEETLAYFSELKNAKNVRVLRYDKPFNYSAINNFAVREAKGSIIGFVNNDIEVISPGWLTEMVSWAAQPDVGCVGAKLYYANDTIQHGGVIVGLGGIANHSHKYFPRHHPGYFSRLKVLQNLSAVTAACLLIRKSVFEEVGGLNEIDLTVAFNDVDLCLKVGAAGYSNVWTPYAELYHLESVSRGIDAAPEKMARFHGEVAYMQGRWKEIIERDPFYSPNLTKTREDFSLG
ncbi:glycosyltransferase [Mesorhizobium sp. M7A.F.Ca.MR.148.00.0.0]|uniref:glycosyltransferase n=1 Tax=Mesorhizobium sp. M7A.F.Ca.MR.148.00.0.0 TaxID=2496775 RepID=UPI000FCB03C1|nr:glycosyltransferase [Mesorhizobium sp. M7A.F.Ca.MR.148.00.0.0]RUV36828.1 glycosyltransferase [Mesorhizobium sp. M7A.F.Ca.MR.148.00.0.0]